jgi:hypothetical protein
MSPSQPTHDHTLPQASRVDLRLLTLTDAVLHVMRA